MVETRTLESIPATAAFDTLAWSDMLQSGGVPRQQAEVHAKVFAQAIGQGVATKADIEILKSDMQAEMQILKSDLLTAIEKQRSELFFWMLGMFLGLAGLIISLEKFV